jgi:hypothetical protein
MPSGLTCVTCTASVLKEILWRGSVKQPSQHRQAVEADQVQRAYPTEAVPFALA